jgi:glycosyltransferase involved in cell wall biosynthesis
MPLKLSIYTFAKDALYFDYHLIDMLKHHLLFADEIVVAEGYSSDGTYEAIKNLDSRIRVFRTHLDTAEPKAWLRRAKDEARRRCTGDWCVLLDCDEFIPEWEFDRIRAVLASTNRHIIGADYLHFYGNYKVHYDNPNRPHPPKVKRIIHRNLPSVEIYGDGSDVRIPTLGAAAEETTTRFACHHFGEVRKASRLRHKWRVQANRDIHGRWDWLPGFLFDLFPHNWLDQDILGHLKIYEGPFVRAVRDNPSEFVRDEFRLYEALRHRATVC